MSSPKSEDAVPDISELPDQLPGQTSIAEHAADMRHVATRSSVTISRSRYSRPRCPWLLPVGVSDLVLDFFVNESI